MNIKDCDVNIRELRSISDNLFNLLNKFDEVKASLDNIDVSKLERNGFKVYIYNDFDGVASILSNRLDGEIYYLDRFESSIVGSKIGGDPVTSVDDIDWYKIRFCISYVDLIAVDIGSLIFLEDSCLTNVTSYPEQLYIVSSIHRLTHKFIDSFELIYNLNRLFGNSFLIRVVSAPSRTGDIEKKIVYGAHGPKDIYIYLVRDTLDPVDIFMSYSTLKYFDSEMCLRSRGYTLDRFINRFHGYSYILD